MYSKNLNLRILIQNSLIDSLITVNNLLFTLTLFSHKFARHGHMKIKSSPILYHKRFIKKNTQSVKIKSLGHIQDGNLAKIRSHEKLVFYI